MAYKPDNVPPMSVDASMRLVLTSLGKLFHDAEHDLELWRDKYAPIREYADRCSNAEPPCPIPQSTQDALAEYRRMREGFERVLDAAIGEAQGVVHQLPELGDAAADAFGMRIEVDESKFQAEMFISHPN